MFAYIDELSAASVAGHTDELATTGRVRERLLERLAADLLDGSPTEHVQEAADRAEWTPPTTLTAVIVPEAQARSVRGALPGVVLQAVDRSDMSDDATLLLVPDAHGRATGRAARLADRPRVHRRPGTSVAAGAGVVRPRAPRRTPTVSPATPRTT